MNYKPLALAMGLLRPLNPLARGEVSEQVAVAPGSLPLDGEG